MPPKKVLAGYIRKAVALNEGGVKVPRTPKRAAAKAVQIPEDLAAGLKKNKKATAIEWMAEGKSRNWKYL